MMAQATVDFPQPDSPTRPNVSPRSMTKLISRTAVFQSGPILYSMSRFSTSSTGCDVTGGSLLVHGLADGVRQKIHSDHERGDSQRREEYRPPHTPGEE